MLKRVDLFAAIRLAVVVSLKITIGAKRATEKAAE